MIRVSVVEDDRECRGMIAGFVRRYASEHELTVTVQEFENGNDLLEEYTGQFDVLFLDILMPGRDGMKTAGLIRERDEEVQIIFITNMTQRASEGYEVDARAFLSKPVSYISVSRAFARAAALISRRKTRYLLLENTREMQRIRLDSIFYIESLGHYIKVHTTNGIVIGLSSMKEIEKKLTDAFFFRCSKSVIVNLEKIDSVNGTRILTDGEEINVSRSRKKELLSALDRYYAGI